jgi:hypothetical protein
MKPPNLIIRTNAIYTLEGLRSSLGLPKSTLSREIRLARLRVTKRAGRYFLLGKWIIQWLEEGEVRRNDRREAQDESRA